ncbi:MAG: NAD-dependent epimerase/dehydratase family protein [Pirellulales bacterium]|nr:NAD-dependent epimerase/dehydratase family protein [Pirellulales bacterium]
MSEAHVTPTSEAELEELLSRPAPSTVRALAEFSGDLLLLGVGGKMGPSLARMARRALDAAGRETVRVIGVSRFSEPGLRDELERDRIVTVACDLLDPAAREKLPDAAHVLFMTGFKFGASSAPWMAWATNVLAPGALLERYRASRVVAFSTGNVYPYVSPSEPAPNETTPPAPVGEYASTALGRERMFQFASARYGTPVCLLRLNYAVDLRYGVPVDIARTLMAGTPIDLSTPRVNMVWQGYANRVALESFARASSPPRVLNLTGRGHHAVRAVAETLGRHLGLVPTFAEGEGERSLLSDASSCHQCFGLPEIDGEELLAMVAAWIRSGGRLLDKPTKFQVRDGRF